MMLYNIYDYHIEVFRDERDGDFGSFIKEIPEVSAFGKTPESAISELKTVFEEWQEICQEKGLPIPLPSKTAQEDTSKTYSGKVLLRLPRSFHRDLLNIAKEENISLNQEILHLLSIGFGMKRGRRV